MEINATFVDPRVRGLNVLDAQSRRICVVIEVSLLVEDVLIGPGYGLMKGPTACIEPAGGEEKTLYLIVYHKQICIFQVNFK